MQCVYVGGGKVYIPHYTYVPLYSLSMVPWSETGVHIRPLLRLTTCQSVEADKTNKNTALQLLGM